LSIIEVINILYARRTNRMAIRLNLPVQYNQTVRNRKYPQCRIINIVSRQFPTTTH